MIPAPEIRDTSLERNSSLGSTKLLKYFERQTAALEKLNERIGKQEKEERIERKGSKIYNLPVELSAVQSESHVQKDISDDTSLLMKKATSEKRPTITVTRNVRRRKTNALEALGQLYLMGKLPKDPTENKILNRSSLLAFIEEEYSEKVIDNLEISQQNMEEEKEPEHDNGKAHLDNSFPEFSERKSTKPFASQREGSELRTRRYLQTRKHLLDIPGSEKSFNDSRNEIRSERSGITSTSKSKSKTCVSSDEENEEAENKSKKTRTIKKPRRSKGNTESPSKFNEMKKNKEAKK